MPKSAALMSVVPGRLVAIAAALMLAVATAACSGTGLIQTRTQGYVIPDDALQQVRPGQSSELVELVLGTPMTRGTFGNENVWYYVETVVDQTAFGLTNVRERTVLAVYFDQNRRVVDTAVYGLEDGRVFTIEQRRTPSFGQDRNFVEQLLASI